MRDNVQKWREMRSVFRYYDTQSRARRKHQENSHQQFESARVIPLVFSLIASQPRSFFYLQKMARNAKCAFSVDMTLGRARQGVGETFTSKSGLTHLTPLLTTSSPVDPVASLSLSRCRPVKWCDCVAGCSQMPGFLVRRPWNSCWNAKFCNMVCVTCYVWHTVCCNMQFVTWILKISVWHALPNIRSFDTIWNHISLNLIDSDCFVQ